MRRVDSIPITVPVQFCVALLDTLQKEFEDVFHSRPQVLFVNRDLFFSGDYDAVAKLMCERRWGNGKYIYGCLCDYLGEKQILLSDGHNELLHTILI